MSSGSINIDPYEIDERQFPILSDSHSLRGNHQNSQRRRGNQSIQRVRANTRRQQVNARVYRLQTEQQGGPDVSEVLVNGRHISLVIKLPVPTLERLQQQQQQQEQTRFQTIRVGIELPSDLTGRVAATVSALGIDSNSNNHNNNHMQLIDVDRILSHHPYTREDINVSYSDNDSSDVSLFGSEHD